jgi:hypothetical protein
MVDQTGGQVYEFDASGHLVREQNETDQEFTVRTAATLYVEGLSPISPVDVAAQFTDPPVIESIDPTEIPMGSEDMTLYITGTNFTANSVINFAGHDEPTTLNEDGTLSTGLKPSLWKSPVVVPCMVSTSGKVSAPVDFSFV